MNVQCNTCQGVYSTVDGLGMRYFHACGPVVDPVTLKVTPLPGARDENITADAARRAVAKSDGAGVTAVAVDANGKTTAVLANAAQLDAALL